MTKYLPRTKKMKDTLLKMLISYACEPYRPCIRNSLDSESRIFSISNPASGSCFCIAPNRKYNAKVTMTSHFTDITSLSLFWRCLISLIKFRYGFTFHVNIITGSVVMTTFVYQGLNRSPKLGSIPV